ncbi:MAG: MauE/DoxX family redox-associated membrane protein [Burkholderiales bacterium]
MTGIREILRWLYGVLFALAGANHFMHTDFYVNIMPAYLPWHTGLVYISGVCEIALGVMLLFRRTERLAAWGMIALIVAVTPANVQMALHPELYPKYSAAALWIRLAFQPVLIAWAYWYTRRRKKHQ